MIFQIKRALEKKLRISTYTSLLLQSQAVRTLKKNYNSILSEYNLSVTEWMLIGQLYDEKELQASEIAEILDVKPPLVTNLIAQLEKKELVVRKKDSKDSRAKVIVMSKKTEELVPKIEDDLKKTMKKSLGKTSLNDLLNYQKVLENIVVTSIH